jgi:hypothetical protein
MAQLNSKHSIPQIVHPPGIPVHVASDFLEALLKPATPDSYLEIRPLPDGEHQYRAWHRVGDLRQHGFERALPIHLDGKVNIYFGACPRIGKAGKAEDVSQATAVWFDEITKPAPDLPPFSWMVETRPGKVQGGYFLKEASRNLDRVCRLVKRLAVCVGGDNVYDRARILRMPGFINAKYPDAPRSYMVEFHPDRRYSLEELERLIPELPPEHVGEGGPTRQHDGPFDPHAGKPLLPEAQEKLGNHILRWGLRRHYDGRYVGACPLPHDNGPSDGNSFYISPLTGSWFYFGSSHQGQRHGGPAALIPGIDDQRWKTAYQADSKSFYRKPGQRPARRLDQTPDVGNRVLGVLGQYSITDRSPLWKHAKGLFPMDGKPWKRAAVMGSKKTMEVSYEQP